LAGTERHKEDRKEPVRDQKGKIVGRRGVRDISSLYPCKT
jgi:hypothetical protein